MIGLARAFAPWAGLVSGSLSWVLHHQVLSDALRYDCAAISPTRAVLALVLALMLCAAGAALSWRAKRIEKAVSSGRTFAAWMSILCAGIFALAILLQAMASLTVPGCFR
jgi:hypothetical protein